MMFKRQNYNSININKNNILNYIYKLKCEI